MKELVEIEAQLDRIAGLLREEPDATVLRVESVSSWSVAEQLDHLLKILEAALGRLARAPQPVDRGINLVGRLLLACGRLPRGIGKSPEKLRGERRERNELAAQLDAVRALLRGLGAEAEIWRDRRPIVRHGYFGGLTALQAARFLAIHTDHHLRIVADIRRASGR